MWWIVLIPRRDALVTHGGYGYRMGNPSQLRDVIVATERLISNISSLSAESVGGEGGGRLP